MSKSIFFSIFFQTHPYLNSPLGGGGPLAAGGVTLFDYSQENQIPLENQRRPTNRPRTYHALPFTGKSPTTNTKNNHHIQNQPRNCPPCKNRRLSNTNFRN